MLLLTGADIKRLMLTGCDDKMTGRDDNNRKKREQNADWM